MPVGKQPEIADVTYKEVMQLWNLGAIAAKSRLTRIRNSLNKGRKHKLTVVQFCKEEDITLDEFYNRVKF